jgi:hypothetical protein
MSLRRPSRSVAVASVLCGLQRRLLDIAPVTGIDAPGQEMGKTLLAHVPSLVATGRLPSIVTFDKWEEFGKSFFSLCWREIP